MERWRISFVDFIVVLWLKAFYLILINVTKLMYTRGRITWWTQMIFSCSGIQTNGWNPVVIKHIQKAAVRKLKIGVPLAWTSKRGFEVNDMHRVFPCKFVWGYSKKCKAALKWEPMMRSTVVKGTTNITKGKSNNIQRKKRKMGISRHMGGRNSSQLKSLDQDGKYLLKMATY